MDKRLTIAVVNVDGDLDVTTVPDLRDRFERLIDRGCRRIFVNMANVGHMDSAGLALMFSMCRRIGDLGGSLTAVRVPDQVNRMLTRMRMAEHMMILREGHSTEVTALDPSVPPLWRRTIRVDGLMLAQARDRLDEILESLPLTNDEVFDLSLASGEALGNAVDHTDKGGILLTLAAYPDRVVVDIADCGGGFKPETVFGISGLAPDAERGRGIQLMRMLVDSVTIMPKTTGEGTVVRLVKMLDVSGVGPA